MNYMKKKDLIEMQLINDWIAIKNNEENTRINKARLQAEKEKNEIERQKLAFEMETRDRINISLNEYTAMQEEIKRLSQDNETYKRALNTIGVTDYDFKSIEKSVVNDPARMEHHLNIRLTYADKLK